MTISLHLGDCVAWAKGYEGPPFHALLCDPPYHLTSIVKRFGGEGSAPAGNDVRTGGQMSIFWIGAGAAVLVAAGWLWGRWYGMRELGATMALVLLANGYKLKGLFLEACGGDEQAEALRVLTARVDEWEDE